MTNHEAPYAHVQQSLHVGTHRLHFVFATNTDVSEDSTICSECDGTERSALTGSGEAIIGELG